MDTDVIVESTLPTFEVDRNVDNKDESEICVPLVVEEEIGGDNKEGEAIAPGKKKKVRANYERNKSRLEGIPSMYDLGEYLRTHDSAIKYFQEKDVLGDMTGLNCSGTRPDSKGRKGVKTNIQCEGHLKVRIEHAAKKRWDR